MAERLTVSAGNHTRANCPVRVEAPSAEWPEHFYLEGPGGALVPGDCLGGELYFTLPALPAGAKGDYYLRSELPAVGVALGQEPERITVSLEGKLVTAYNFAPKWVRPFLYPLIGPGDRQVTRNWPMVEVEGEHTDHKHHKSVWVAHGDLNGTDNWSEEEGHGWQRHQRFELLFSGAAMGKLVAQIEWQTHEGVAQLEERRELTFWRLPGGNLFVDFDLAFTAVGGSILFGDTKEGGLLSVRVATELDVQRTGTITNSFGGVNEVEAWGKRAHWCDYSGSLDKAELGIAILEAQTNRFHPTYWHARDYGLMTANPFGISHFDPASGRRGDFTLAEGETERASYRLYVHAGDAHQGQVAESYLDYVAPPEVSFG